MRQTRQRGQAIVEMLVVIVAIFMLFWGLLWLQRWQQIKLQTQHHAALQAFRFSHSYEVSNSLEQAPDYLRGLYSPIAHEQTTDAQALGAMPAQHLFLDVAQQEGLLGNAQRWRFSSLARGEGMQLQSQIGIWVGAGHALSDTQAMERLESSISLWQYAQRNSTTAIKTLSPLLKPVDAGWGRKAPSTTWLQPWQESVPAHHIFKK